MTARPFPRIGRPGAAPTITTERLTLRPMVLDDWPRYRDTMGGARSTHSRASAPSLARWFGGGRGGNARGRAPSSLSSASSMSATVCS